MASVSSKTDQIVDEKLEEKNEVDDIKLDGEENTVASIANVSEEKPESEDFSNVEGLEKIEVNVKDLEFETGLPEEEKKENDDLNASTSTEVSVKDVQVQSSFPEEHEQEKSTETQEPTSIHSGDEEKEVFSDQGRAPEAVEIEKEASEVSSKDQEVSASDERKISESLKDVDATLEYFTTFDHQVIEENNKNESTSKNNFETTPEFAAEVVKDNSVVEKNVQIPAADDKKEETQLEEAIQIATDKSEKKDYLGTEKEESHEKSETKLIKESTKRESNNLFSKVKRSIVKAKKAILGKSLGPKTLSSETKDDNS